MSVTFAKAVVDAGPLFTMLTLVFARKHDREAILGRAHIPRDPEIQAAYWRLFDDVGTLLTTSHVVGELQGLQNSRLGLKGMDLEHFWLSGIDFLIEKNFDERLIGLLAMHAEERSRQRICSFGPADAGVTELALREKCVLFTDDGTLRDFAGRNGVRCELVQELVRGAL